MSTSINKGLIMMKSMVQCQYIMQKASRFEGVEKVKLSMLAIAQSQCFQDEEQESQRRDRITAAIKKCSIKRMHLVGIKATKTFFICIPFD